MAERQPEQVAKRAVILGAIAFRASLEVMDHPRVVEISRRLLPWLRDMGCDDELDPIERELLSTPLGYLSAGQKTDANWAGEAAAFFCWMLNHYETPEEASLADQSRLPDLLCIMKPEASKIIRAASLRDRAEIHEMCCRFVLIRSILQESRVDSPAREIVRRVNIKTLNDVGLDVKEDVIKRASEIVSRMTLDERGRVAGLYFVRSLAALWFLSDRSTYFG
jgi:hypothetical protein